MVYYQASTDDIFPWDIVTTQGPCPLRVQSVVHLVETWSDEWAVTFNVSKCQFIDIMTTRAVTPLLVLLHNQAVPQVIEFKYLGVWVNSQLRWNHIQEFCRLCLNWLKNICKLCARYWGLHPRVVSVLM